MIDINILTWIALEIPKPRQGQVEGAGHFLFQESGLARALSILLIVTHLRIGEDGIYVVVRSHDIQHVPWGVRS